MKKADQLRVLNRLVRAIKGHNGFDRTEEFGAYSLGNTGRLKYTDAEGVEMDLGNYTIEEQIHTALAWIEAGNR